MGIHDLITTVVEGPSTIIGITNNAGTAGLYTNTTMTEIYDSNNDAFVCNSGNCSIVIAGTTILSAISSGVTLSISLNMSS